MLIRHAITVLIIATITSGCDKFSGDADQKTSDAQAIGYACRVSLKKPEDCMKENTVQSTTSILTGWKAADTDISERKLDPNMGSDPATAVIIKPASAPEATGKIAPTEDKPPEKNSGK
jgi:hypothetical protein